MLMRHHDIIVLVWVSLPCTGRVSVARSQLATSQRNNRGHRRCCLTMPLPNHHSNHGVLLLWPSGWGRDAGRDVRCCASCSPLFGIRATIWLGWSATSETPCSSSSNVQRRSSGQMLRRFFSLALRRFIPSGPQFESESASGKPSTRTLHPTPAQRLWASSSGKCGCVFFPR